MTLHVLTRDYSYEGDEAQGVYSSMDKAMTAMQRQAESHSITLTERADDDGQPRWESAEHSLPRYRIKTFELDR